MREIIILFEVYPQLFLCICRNVAKGSESAYGHEVIRGLEADLAVIGAYMAEVWRLILETPVVEKDDRFASGNCRLYCFYVS